MVRAPDAPIETAKFMGHGFCDHITKSITLTKSTYDLAVITQTIFDIKNILNVSAKELRGIGIQISKLDAIQNETHRSNALKNMFEKVQAKTAKNSENTSNQGSNKFSIEQELSSNNLANKSRHGLRKFKSFNGTPTRDINDNLKVKAPNQKLLKIYEELDLNVLAELPEDIRKEVLKEQQRILELSPANKTEANFRGIDLGTINKKFKGRKLEDDFLKNDEEHDELQSLPEEETESSSSNELIQVRILFLTSGIEIFRLAKKLINIRFQLVSEENILKSSDWRQVLSHWLQSGFEPVDCDVKIITEYFKEYTQTKRLCEVTLCLRFLYR